MEMPNKLLEAHFCSISSQSNVYGLAKLPMADGMDKLLIASTRRKVYVFEYVLKQVNPSKIVHRSNISNKNLLPSSRELHFTYIPSAAEIISIDAFNRSTHGNDFVVGITFMRNPESSKSAKRQSHKPMRKRRGQPVKKQSEQPVIQQSDRSAAQQSDPSETQNSDQPVTQKSDQSVKQQIDQSAKQQNEKPPKQYFLNLYSDCDSGTAFDLDRLAQTCMSIQLDFIPYQLTHTELILENSKEIVWLLSGSDNKVHLFREDKLNICNSFNEDICEEYFPEFIDCPSIVLMMKIKYFDDYKKRLTVFGCENGYIKTAVVKTESSVGEESQDSTDSSTSDDFLQFHILACSALELTAVFRNVLEDEFKNAKILKNSNKFDCVLAGCVADIDMDGVNEVLLGTYGQELLCYKLDTKSQLYQLTWQKSLAHPILALYYEDITDDGLKELMVLSVRGLHILQHDLDEVANLCMKRLSQVAINLNKADTFKALQSEDL
ncbi:KICSTOR complex protein kaptin [Nymphon striatum]|nr:KICSTOR complex protein kaptin [Nymphon striatum]